MHGMAWTVKARTRELRSLERGASLDVRPVFCYPGLVEKWAVP